MYFDQNGPFFKLVTLRVRAQPAPGQSCILSSGLVTTKNRCPSPEAGLSRHPGRGWPARAPRHAGPRGPAVGSPCPARWGPPPLGVPERGPGTGYDPLGAVRGGSGALATVAQAWWGPRAALTLQGRVAGGRRQVPNHKATGSTRRAASTLPGPGPAGLGSPSPRRPVRARWPAALAGESPRSPCLFCRASGLSLPGLRALRRQMESFVD